MNLDANVPDLGQYATNPLTGTVTPSKASTPTFYDIGELTPSEENAIQAAMLKVQRRWMGKTFTEEDPTEWTDFARELRNRLAEIGFVLDIQWELYEADDMPGKVAVPNVTVLGRTEPEGGTDHTLIQHEVTKGLDGKAGYIREDGTWSEDPIRKNIL